MKPLLLLIGLLLTTAVSQAQEFPSAQKKEAWEQFKTKEGANWNIRWDKNTGLPKTLVGTSQTKFKAEPVIATKAFLMQNMELFSFKSELADLQHVETKVTNDVNHVEFQQYYKGLKIEGAQYKVHIRKDGTVDMVNGNYYPTIDISAVPNITGNSAIEAVLSDLKLQANDEGENTAELIIFPKDESFYWSQRRVKTLHF